MKVVRTKVSVLFLFLLLFLSSSLLLVSSSHSTTKSMDQEENPYTILGVAKDATEAEIKTAYRKAALRYHPDKQKNEQDRQTATEHFAKLSNAYEILSDPQLKRKFDMEQQYSQYDQRTFHEPFRRYHFHDPFQIFEQVFREEFGRSNRQSSHGSSIRRDHHFFAPDPFFARDGFFEDPFFSHNRPTTSSRNHRTPSTTRDSFFDHDPFFSNSGSGGGGLSPFGAFFGGQDPYTEMRKMQESLQEQFYTPSNQPPKNSRSYPSDDTSTITSTSTFTRIINGKQQTVTERIVRKRDGTIVEHHRETTGDDDFPQTAALPYHHHPTSTNHKQLESNHHHQQQMDKSSTSSNEKLQRHTTQHDGKDSRSSNRRRGWFW